MCFTLFYIVKWLRVFEYDQPYYLDFNKRLNVDHFKYNVSVAPVFG